MQFKEAILMPSQLGIVMEYAAGGDLRVREQTIHGIVISRQPFGSSALQFEIGHIFLTAGTRKV